jgi:hypothetical protein
MAATKGGRIGDEAVKARTGRIWAEWFRILDAAKAGTLTHTQIATHLHDAWDLSGWWCQMVAVRYEQERGLREPLQTCTGDFAANTSRAMAAPIATLYRAFHDAAARRRWLPDAPLEITTATANKSIRAKWGDTKGRVSFYFYAQGSGKARVAVDHMGIESAKDAERLKAWWAERLEKLRSQVEA